jgi:hypothetical protein
MRHHEHPPEEGRIFGVRKEYKKRYKKGRKEGRKEGKGKRPEASIFQIILLAFLERDF